AAPSFHWTAAVCNAQATSSSSVSSGAGMAAGSGGAPVIVHSIRTTRRDQNHARYLDRAHQDFTIACTIGRPHHAALFHHLHNLRGSVVSNRHLSLQPRRRAALRVGHDTHGFIEARVERLLLRSVLPFGVRLLLHGVVVLKLG